LPSVSDLRPSVPSAMPARSTSCTAFASGLTAAGNQFFHQNSPAIKDGAEQSDAFGDSLGLVILVGWRRTGEGHVGIIDQISDVSSLLSASLEPLCEQARFRKEERRGDVAGSRWLEVVPPKGQTSVVLSSAAAFDKQPGEGAYLTFACDDIQATVNELRARGVSVTDPIEEPWGTYIKATDPDGHQVQISQKD
jgi:predicted enzyme related to lactoylglutathione lyase